MRRYWIDAAATAALAAVLCGSVVTPAAAQRARSPAVAQPTPAVAPCRSEPGAPRPAVDIPFAPRVDPTLKDPDGPAKTFRVDFARVEHDCPLSPADLMKLTPENLAALSQEEVDQIYARLTAGPIPNGPYRGTLFFAKGDSLASRLEEILGGIPGRLADSLLELMETVGSRLWKGKVFERQNGLLRNMIEDHPLLRPLVDTRDILTTQIPREVFGRRFSSITNEVWLLFPAKVYCGQSLLDSRRESIVVDYAYTDELEKYRDKPDSTAGRGGIRIRDEIRMVRPGFYLGRAYTNKMFLLNFTLSNPDEEKRQGRGFAEGAAVTEDCWPGEQVRRAAAR
jgi:hypothetical protein